MEEESPFSQITDADSPNIEPYMQDRADAGILGAYDATDVIQEIRYNLRRYEIRKDDSGEMKWMAPEPTYATKHMDKNKIIEEWGSLDNFFAALDDEGGKVDREMDNTLVCKIVTKEAVKPLVNLTGEHDIINLLTSFMNRNIYLTNMPGKSEDKFVYKLINRFSHDFIVLLGVNAKRYEIQEPKHLSLIVWIVIPNVFAALQMAVGAGGRLTLEKVLGETKIMQERILGPGEIG